jgi:predicted transcriptional regulator of viral defense system
MDTDLRLRSELLADGLSDNDLARLRRSGGLGRVRRGAYVDGADPRLRDREARHALAVRAALRQLRSGAVASHVSAAVLHGLPVWGMALDRVHVARDGVSGGHRRPGLHVHVAPLRADEVTVRHGVPVTTVARTLAERPGRNRSSRPSR